MALAFNPKEEAHQLTKEEAWAFFDESVQERLSISGREFLARREEFKNSPHYDSLMFILPLVQDVEE